MQSQLAGQHSTDREDVSDNLKNKLYFRISYYTSGLLNPKNDRL
jgi:hypothetical protein